MALAILLFVFFIVVLMIAFFVFPPTMWVKWFYNEELENAPRKGASVANDSLDKTTEKKTS